MTKAVAIIVAVLFVLSSNFLSVAVSAADYNKIDISDYVSGREFVGDDVIVSYDLPLDPWTELYGFETGSNTPKLIDSFNGNLYFVQDEIDSFGYYLDSFYYFYLLDFYFMGLNNGYLYAELQTREFDYDEFVSCTHVAIDGELYSIVWDSFDPQYGYALGHVDSAGVKVLTIQLDLAGNVFRIGWLEEFRVDADFEVEFGVLDVVSEGDADYQRINGQIFPLGKSNARTNIISVGDIKSGSGFTLSFDLRYYIEHDAPDELNGNIAYYDAVWLDKDFNEISRSQEEIDWAPYPQYYEYQFDIDFTVPQGASYFYLDFTTGYFYVNTAYEFSWVITDITMSATLSSIEENSQTMQKVQQKLEKLDEQLGDIKDQLTPTPEQNDKAEQLEQEIGNASDKLENNNSTLEDLTPTRPEINTDLTLDEEKLFAVAPLVTNIWSLSGMTTNIGIVLLVATVAYIFFGKRDS